MTGRRLFGTETEYAVAAIRQDGTVWPTPRLNDELLRHAQGRLIHLPGSSGGLFLSNGSRLYVDYGHHPEIATPECLHPRDAVRYSRAGDRILLGLANAVQNEHPELAEVVVRTGNVDYCGELATWGGHESYCHRADPEAVRRALVPHLVSRTVWAGAGGFDPFSPGVEFMLSPRARHIRCVSSGNSTGNRGIVDLREEALASHGYRRQHVLCGESLRSDLAAWLRIGTTALVVAMREAGLPCGEDVAVDGPLEALGVFARDTGCRRSVSTAAGRLTAIQIQRRYLACALEHLESAWMPEWAREACTRWDQVLSRLERGPETCQRSLDWAIKLAVFRDRVRRRGFEWDLLPVWTQIADRLQQARRAESPPADRRPAGDIQLRSPLRDAVASVRPLLREHGLRLGDFSRFLALRHELFEVDVRFGQLGPRSVFDALDASGVLDHAVPGVDRIDEAIDEPPAEGRARLRGAMIRQSAGQGRYSCMWESVLDHRTEARFDLSDPFAERSHWTRGAQRPVGAVAGSRTTAQEPPRRAQPAASTRRTCVSPPPRPRGEAPRPLFARLMARLRAARDLGPPADEVPDGGDRL